MIKLGGSPNFLTEFGVCSFNAQDPSDPDRLNTNECEVILDYCDSYFTSWAWWDANFYYYKNFQINFQLVEVFSRVYPKFTNGIPLNLSFNFTTGRFVYSFKMNLNKTDSKPTEIFIPAHVYPKGFEVMTNHELAWSFDSFKKTLYLYLKDEDSPIFYNYFFVVLFKN
jgi:hypothetical protein